MRCQGAFWTHSPTTKRWVSHTGLVPIQTWWVIIVGLYSCRSDKRALCWISCYNMYGYGFRWDHQRVPDFNVTCRSNADLGQLTVRYTTSRYEQEPLAVILMPHEYHNQLTLLMSQTTSSITTKI